MAMAVQTAVRSVDRVIEAVLAIYAGHQERAVTTYLGEVCDRRLLAELADVPCAVAGTQRIVEIVIDGEPDCDMLTRAVWTLAARGWHVVTLVPLERLGEAHGALRGSPCLLQPWWLDGDTVRFGRTETP